MVCATAAKRLANSLPAVSILSLGPAAPPAGRFKSLPHWDRALQLSAMTLASLEDKLAGVPLAAGFLYTEARFFNGIAAHCFRAEFMVPARGSFLELEGASQGRVCKGRRETLEGALQGRVFSVWHEDAAAEATLEGALQGRVFSVWHEDAATEEALEGALQGRVFKEQFEDAATEEPLEAVEQKRPPPLSFQARSGPLGLLRKW